MNRICFFLYSVCDIDNDAIDDSLKALEDLQGTLVSTYSVNSINMSGLQIWGMLSAYLCGTNIFFWYVLSFDLILVAISVTLSL